MRHPVCKTTFCLCLCRGLWNVPYITQVYLIKGSVLRTKLSQVSLYMDEGGMDADMVFCRSIRDQVTQTFSAFNCKHSQSELQKSSFVSSNAVVSLNFIQTKLNMSTGSLHVCVQPWRIWPFGGLVQLQHVQAPPRHVADLRQPCGQENVHEHSN